MDSPPGAYARDMALQQEVESLLREASSHGFSFDAKAVFDAVTGVGSHSYAGSSASSATGRDFLSAVGDGATASAPYVSDETLDPSARSARDAARAGGVGASSSLAGEGDGGSTMTGGSSADHFFHWLERRNAKREALKAQLSQERAYEPECTFSPNMAASKRTFQGSQVSKALLDRMYDWSRRRKMKLTQAVQQVRKEATSECTFSPRITKLGATAQSRLPQDVRKALAAPAVAPAAKWDRDLLDDATKKQLEARQSADASAFLARMNAGREKARRINEIADIKITTGAKYTGKITIPEAPALATSARSRARHEALGGSTALTQPAASRVIGGGGSTWKRPTLRETMAAMRAEEEYRALADGRAPDPSVWGGSAEDYYGEAALSAAGYEEGEEGEEGYGEGESGGAGEDGGYYYGSGSSEDGGAVETVGGQPVYVAPPGAPLPPGAIPLYVVPPSSGPAATTPGAPQGQPPTVPAAAGAAGSNDPFAALAELQRLYGQTPTVLHQAPPQPQHGFAAPAAAAAAQALDADLAREAALAALAGRPLPAAEPATATRVTYTVSASRPGTVVVGTDAVPAVATLGQPLAPPPAPPAPVPDVDTALLNVLSAYGVPANQAAAAASPAPLTPRSGGAAGAVPPSPSSSKLPAASPFLRQDLPGLARSGDADPLLRHLAVLKAAEEVKRARAQAVSAAGAGYHYGSAGQVVMEAPAAYAYQPASNSNSGSGSLSVRELYAALPPQAQQPQQPQPGASVMVVRAGPTIYARY